ncbi:MAG: hypothetical protein C0507_04175 [Cyanobacteria bacterium PR.3.49]|nr:hypothetical protein [Cyanobacteria bacterium PR.3.49]
MMFQAAVRPVLVKPFASRLKFFACTKFSSGTRVLSTPKQGSYSRTVEFKPSKEDHTEGPRLTGVSSS